jgi:hypothetical protein
MKIRGEIEIRRDGKTVWQSKNLIVDNALMVTMLNALSMTSIFAGPIYRFGLGNGGADSIGNRILPADDWNTKLDVGSPLGYQDITTQVAIWNPASMELRIENTITVAANDYGAPLTFNEMGLYTGQIPVVAAWPVVAGAPIGWEAAMHASDYLFAYQTVPSQTVLAGATIDVSWNIVISKDI